MGCTIDHLASFHRITVIEEFTDLRGVQHRRGESGVIQLMELDWATQEIRIHWERDQKRETMAFALKATTGPRNGHMKEFFEKGDYVAPETPGKKFIPGFGLVATAPPELPAVTHSVIRDKAQFEGAIQRVWALVGRKRFDEAEEQLLAIPSDSFLTAKGLGEIAERHAFEPDGSVYEWLRDRAINHWYAWGATATSGGEGAERMLDIGPAVERFKKLDAWRKANAP
jgi:hypothetical protein